MPRKSPKIAPPAPKAATVRPTKAKVNSRVAKQRESAPAATKASAIVTALRRPNGASLADLVAATGWQSHSVRGFLSGTVRKRLGLTLTVEQAGGERRYHVS